MSNRPTVQRSAYVRRSWGLSLGLSWAMGCALLPACLLVAPSTAVCDPLIRAKGEHFIVVWADAKVCDAPADDARCLAAGGERVRADVRTPGHRSAVAWEWAGDRGDWFEVVSSSAGARPASVHDQGRHCHARPQGEALDQLELHFFVRRNDVLRVVSAPVTQPLGRGAAVALLPGVALEPPSDGASGPAVAFASVDELEVPIAEIPKDSAWMYRPSEPRPQTYCAGDDECGLGSLCVDSRCRAEPATVVDAAAALVVGERPVLRTNGRGPKYVSSKAPAVGSPDRVLVGLEGRCTVVKVDVDKAALNELVRDPMVQVQLGLERPDVTPKPVDGTIRQVASGAKLSWPDGRPAGFALDSQARRVVDSTDERVCLRWPGSLRGPGGASEPLTLCVAPKDAPASVAPGKGGLFGAP